MLMGCLFSWGQAAGLSPEADFSSLHRQLQLVLSASQEMELVLLEPTVLNLGQFRSSGRFWSFLGPLVSHVF